MRISHVEIKNFRALESLSIPLTRFSVLLGENDVGKTTLLCALERWFANKKLDEDTDWFKGKIENPIQITLTLEEHEAEELNTYKRESGKLVIVKTFAYQQSPETFAILDDGTTKKIASTAASKHFGPESFHLIPVRRDLAVQFSMAKTALLGKTLRALMKKSLADKDAQLSLQTIQKVLGDSIDGPRAALQSYLRQQLRNDSYVLFFDDVQVDPVEGVSFSVRLADDKIETTDIEKRGAGTQNNLIIALFRFIAEKNVNGAIVFAMEEPENSLHPKAQRQLLNVVQKISEASQVIVTTHSPVFIDRTKYENNILLTRLSDGRTIAKTFHPELLLELRDELGIRPSDALLKGGGNCALLVEGATEEDAFPVWMAMQNMSDFQLGIAVINMNGSDTDRVRRIVALLRSYEIPCVIVLDSDAKNTETDLRREMLNKNLPNIKEIICLSKGTIEDYFPLSIVAEVINREFAPEKRVEPSMFDSSKNGAERLKDFSRVMREVKAAHGLGYLKRALGNLGARLMQEESIPLDQEIIDILELVRQQAIERP